jgi:uncharacterized protein with ATP-grasp and redox domains
MRTYLDCYPCFLRQALSAARRAGADEDQQRLILQRTCAELQTLPERATPPQMAERIHRLVRAEVDHSDPYLAAKQEATRAALERYPVLREHVRTADEPLDAAIRISIAGNIIDFGIFETYDLDATVDRVLTQPFAIDDRPRLRAALADAREVLFLADNAGETVFDRVLIEALDRPVCYVVKGSPVINDATREDAQAAGIDAIAEVMDNGSDAVGTLVERCSTAFRARLAAADLVIAKGQANYESLSSGPPPCGAPIFFLLQAKCSVIAAELGVATGSIIARQR